MEISEAQKQAVAGWARDGAGLSEIQARLRSEFGIAATYMDVRFLVIDMGLVLRDKPAPSRGAMSAADARGPQAEPEPELELTPDLEPRAAGGAGGVKVELDRVMKPGALVSGSVTFSDGVSASWMLDQLGRLAIQSARPGYRPTQQDMAAFQDELRRALEKQGY